MTAVPTDDRLFRVVFEGSPDALLLTDDDGDYIDANGAAEELLGCPKAELVGRSIAEFLSDGVDFDSIRRSFLEGETPHARLDIHRPDGAVRTVQFAVSADVLPGIHLSAIRDVSGGELDERKFGRRIEMLAKVFETSPVAILIADSRGNIVDANDRAGSVFGLEDETLSGRTYHDDRWRAIGDDGKPLPKSERPITKVFDTGEAVFDVEHGIERQDGNTVWLSVDAAPLYGSDEAIERVVAVVSDITESREYRRLLEQQNELLERYSATVSHDLRTPLSVASGWLEVAIEEESAESMDRVQNALERMGDLITDLRELGRCGQVVERMAETDLQNVAETAWSNVETAEATLDIGADLWSIMGDRTRLLRLFENLFRNAVEHAGPDVTVRVGTFDSGFYVEDDGPGIVADRREFVFEFGHTTTDDGTGIGLAIVQAVAHAHGWEIVLTDADPNGARFEFQPRWHPERGG